MIIILFSIVFVDFVLPEDWMKKSIVLIPLPSLIKNSFVRSCFVVVVFLILFLLLFVYCRIVQVFPRT